MADEPSLHQLPYPGAPVQLLGGDQKTYRTTLYPMTPDRLGLETLAKSRDVRPRLGDGLLYRRQRQGSAVLLCAVPCLCDPDRILVRRIARDYVAAATRHRLCSPQQDVDYHIALAGFREHFANQSVHGSRLRS